MDWLVCVSRWTYVVGVVCDDRLDGAADRSALWQRHSVLVVLKRRQVLVVGDGDAQLHLRAERRDATVTRRHRQLSHDDASTHTLPPTQSLR